MTTTESRLKPAKMSVFKACCALIGVGLVVVMMMGSPNKSAAAYPSVRRRLSTTRHHQSHSDRSQSVTTHKQHSHKEEIPKIIHQIYLGFDANLKDKPTIPDRLLRWREQCRFIHSEYEMRFWSKPALEHLIQTKYEFLWETWQGWSSEWIKQADAARYIVLNEFGGVYMDLDYSCESPVDSIIEDASIVLNRGIPGGEYFEYIDNSFMASIPHHWFWRRVLTAMVERAHLTVLASTGPHMLSSVLYDVCGKKPEIKLDPLNRTYHDPDVEKYEIVLATTEMKKSRIRHHNTATWLGLYKKNHQLDKD